MGELGPWTRGGRDRLLVGAGRLDRTVRGRGSQDQLRGEREWAQSELL